MRVESRIGEKLKFKNLLQSGITLSRSIDEMELSLAEGRVEFVINSPDSQEEDHFSEDLACLPKKQREEVVLWFKYVSRLRQSVKTCTEKSLTPLIPEIAKELNDSTPANWRTLARWNESYSSNGQTVRALFSDQMKRGNRTTRLTDEVEGYIKDAIETFKTKKRISIQEAWDILDGYALMIRIQELRNTETERNQF